jgi:hypothetical protein
MCILYSLVACCDSKPQHCTLFRDKFGSVIYGTGRNSVQLDIKLKWDSHIKKIQNKMITQMFALIRLTISTWKACFKKIKHVYSVVVRFVITYDSSTWHASHDRSDTILSLTNKLINLQKQNLRTINETFRITSREVLNVETQMQFIELHLAYLQCHDLASLHTNSTH